VFALAASRQVSKNGGRDDRAASGPGPELGGLKSNETDPSVA
jgi:hypothetical protein